MSLIDSLTSEDLPLSYRFPRWNSALYYPCASIVIFDVDSDSDVEYHIFVAEVDVNPEQIDPRASVIATDGNWRDLTGRAITNIATNAVVTATGTDVTLTINYDDNTSEIVMFSVAALAGTGGGADSESVAIRVDSDGNLAFGGNFVGDTDSIRTQIKTLLDITDSRLIWDEQTVNSEQRFYLTQFIDDTTGLPIDIEDTDIDESHPGNTATLLWVSGTPAPIAGPGEFLPTFTLFALDRAGNRITTSNPSIHTLNWDDIAEGFGVQFNNPTDREGQAYIFLNNDLIQTIGTIDTDLTGYSTPTDTGVIDRDVFTTLYRTDRTTDDDESFFPMIANDDSDGGTASFDISVQQRINTDDINNIGSFPLTPGTELFVSPSMDYNLRYEWSIPSHDQLTITRTDGFNGANTNFLQSYDGANFSISHSGVTNVTNSGIIAHTVTARAASSTFIQDTDVDFDQNSLIDGTITFQNPITHSNQPVAGVDGISLTTTYTRPEAVAGRVYDIRDTTNTDLPMGTFEFPSVWFTLGTASVSGTNPPPTFPDVDNLISDTNFINPVVNGVQVDGNINVSSTTDSLAPLSSFTAPNNTALWFGVRTAVANTIIGFDVLYPGFSIPTRVDVTDTVGVGSTIVPIQPNPLPANYIGYTAVGYTFYGFKVSGDVTRITIITS